MPFILLEKLLFFFFRFDTILLASLEVTLEELLTSIPFSANYNEVGLNSRLLAARINNA